MNFPILERHRRAAVSAWYVGDGMDPLGEGLPSCEADRRYVSGAGPWARDRLVQARLNAFAQAIANADGEATVRCAMHSTTYDDLAHMANVGFNVAFESATKLPPKRDVATALVLKGWS